MIECNEQNTALHFCSILAKMMHNLHNLHSLSRCKKKANLRDVILKYLALNLQKSGYKRTTIFFLNHQAVTHVHSVFLWVIFLTFENYTLIFYSTEFCLLQCCNTIKILLVFSRHLLNAKS